MWPFSKRASLNNPTTPISAINVESELAGAFLSGPSASGMSVNETSGQSLTAVSAAIKLISETIAQIPVNLHEKTADGSVIAHGHPLNDLVKTAPNDDQTSFCWRQSMQQQSLSTGNAYSFVARGTNTGRPLALETIEANNVAAARENGKLVFYVNVNNNKVKIDPANILHIPAMTSGSNILGVSPIRAHAETLGIGLAAEKFGAQFFGQGASLGAVLEMDDSLGKDAKVSLKSQWDALKGSGYTGVAVLEEGLKYKRIGVPPNEAQFLETRKFQVTEVARIYNIPPHMLRDLEKSSFNNIVEQGIEYIRYTMMPWIVKWEQELDRKLLTPAERGKYYFKFNVNGLLRGTQKDRYESYKTGILTGFLSANEVRELEDLNKQEGLDEYLVPLNMTTTSNLVKEAEQEEVSNDTGQERDFTPIIERSSECLARWYNSVKDGAKTQDDFISKIISGLDQALERHVLATAKTIYPDSFEEKIKEVRNKILSLEVDEKLEQAEISGVFHGN